MAETAYAKIGFVFYPTVEFAIYKLVNDKKTRAD